MKLEVAQDMHPGGYNFHVSIKPKFKWVCASIHIQCTGCTVTPDLTTHVKDG